MSRKKNTPTIISNNTEKKVLLQTTEEGLILTDGEISLKGDFLEMLPRLKQSNLEKELLVKAAKIKGNPSPIVLDATAGLGEDSILLAASGCRVLLYESNETIAALLQDALSRAATIPELAQIVQRMELHAEDSICAMNEMARLLEEETEIGKNQETLMEGVKTEIDSKILRPDVIFLDPMFPARQKSASVKKKFQLLQQLERPCGNEKELLEAAFRLRPYKIVIKRPVKGAVLGERKPDYSLSGKAIRYDCFTMAR